MRRLSLAVRKVKAMAKGVRRTPLCKGKGRRRRLPLPRLGRFAAPARALEVRVPGQEVSQGRRHVLAQKLQRHATLQHFVQEGKTQLTVGAALLVHDYGVFQE